MGSSEKQGARAETDDWGGVSPVTPDHVNPEAPWPHLELLEEQTRACGKALTQRLALYPSYVLNAPCWVDERLHMPLLRSCDGAGFARSEAWSPGSGLPVPKFSFRRLAKESHGSSIIKDILEDKIPKPGSARNRQNNAPEKGRVTLLEVKNAQG